LIVSLSKVRTGVLVARNEKIYIDDDGARYYKSPRYAIVHRFLKRNVTIERKQRRARDDRNANAEERVPPFFSGGETLRFADLRFDLGPKFWLRISNHVAIFLTNVASHHNVSVRLQKMDSLAYKLQFCRDRRETVQFVGLHR